MIASSCMPQSSFDLAASAQQEMTRQGFKLQPLSGAEEQLSSLRAAPASPDRRDRRDLRNLPWSSIDNDTSRDLDQAEVAEGSDDGIRIRVAIADVAASLPKGSPLDQFAAEQTQTVYTAVRNFPMLPVQLSTDLTSLNEAEDRSAVVTEFTVGAGGELKETSIYEALIRNGAQLAYSKVGPWLENGSEGAAKISSSPDLAEQLRLQAEAALALHQRRLQEGALDFTRVEADPRVVDGQVQSMGAARRNKATELIEELMIATNETIARMLAEANRSCIRRVVRSPERWPRIVEVAKRYGVELPPQPDSGALNLFLTSQRQSDADHYPELALSIIKLMGPGQYVLSRPGDREPYSDDELAAIATHCNERESAARKVERSMQKREAAVALSGRIGDIFSGVVTGASIKGTYVRVFDPPVEGRIMQQEQGLDVGDRVHVALLRTDPKNAFIDFKRV